MSSSPSFPNMPTDSQLPEIGTSDPMGTNAPNQSAGGATKVNKTDMSGPSSEVSGYGHMSPDLANVGQAPGNGSGVLTDNNGQGNSSGIPAAKPIEPMTFGDPNHTAIDAKENSTLGAGETERHGF